MSNNFNKTVILYGMRGAGKSTVGKLLAGELGYDFFDLDNVIADKHNEKLNDYIKQVGWDEFRDEEYRCLKEVLKQENKKGRVISLGGGTIVFERNRDEIFKDKNTKIVYLDTSLEEITKRISKDEKSGDTRNSLTGKIVLDELEEVYKEREEIYKNSCDFSVDNNGKIDRTVAEISYKLIWRGICIPLTDFSNIDEIYEDIKKDRKIEYVELRIDFLNDYSDLEKYIFKCPKKVICTNRAVFEGGEFSGTEEESMEVLQECVEYGAEYIDIELESYLKLSRDRIYSVPTDKLILSHHNFNKTPEISQLKKVLEKMKQFSPAVYKIACMPNDYADVEKVYHLQEYFNREYVHQKSVFISMGELGLQTRIDGPKMGGKFSFGSYGKTLSAPGQIDYGDLWNKVFNEQKLFGKNIYSYENFTLENNKDLSIGGNKRVLFLGGRQIAGSFSPFMHNFSSSLLTIEENKFFYTLAPLESKGYLGVDIVGEFINFLDSDDKFLGANITMPYKIEVYNYLKENKQLDTNALLVGAVNTLYKKYGKIRGTNTDIEGIKLPIQEKLGENIDMIEDCYVLGAGGAARAAIAAMIQLGIKNIYVLNRSQKKLDEVQAHFFEYLGQDQKLITQIYDVEKKDNFSLPWGEMPEGQRGVIINTLPFGFKENLPQSPIGFSELGNIYGNIALYYEAVYDADKGDTPIVERILEYNEEILICRGVEMLIAQAKKGFELWSEGGKFQTEKIKKILLK